MAPRPAVAAVVEVHHGIPRCLLGLRDRADAHPEPLSGGGIQLWLDYECEAMRHGVDPDASRDELCALIDGSTLGVPRVEHRTGHAEDFARWGRRGGLATLRLYGPGWFGMLARRRWQKITAEALAEAFATMGGRS